jgi:DNA-binding CsgD family transcriptional regulator
MSPRATMIETPLGDDAIEEIVGAQIGDQELRTLTPRMVEAIALRRSGLTLAQTSRALGKAKNTIKEALAAAQARGVSVEGPPQ